MWPDSYQIDVTDEQREKLEAYHALLVKWQKAINLVSNATLDDAWVRHFADSAQLLEYIPRGTTAVMDWGSGAGFPGLVLAILKPDIDFYLVESDERKCQFMRTVSRETSAPIRIHTQRIESLDVNFKPDVIMARALASVCALLDYARPWLQESSDLQMLLLKGEKADDELQAARESHDFDVESYQSVTDKSASILRLSNIKLKCA